MSLAPPVQGFAVGGFRGQDAGAGLDAQLVLALSAGKLPEVGWPGQNTCTCVSCLRAHSEICMTGTHNS